MDLKDKIEETTKFLKTVKGDISSLEEQLKALKEAEQQIVGRLTTYSELQSEFDKSTEVVADNSVEVLES